MKTLPEETIAMSRTITRARPAAPSGAAGGGRQRNGSHFREECDERYRWVWLTGPVGPTLAGHACDDPPMVHPRGRRGGSMQVRRLAARTALAGAVAISLAACHGGSGTVS